MPGLIKGSVNTLAGGLHGQEDVGAGVAIGDRENI
jgi:hypothetical protein